MRIIERLIDKSPVRLEDVAGLSWTARADAVM